MATLGEAPGALGGLTRIVEARLPDQEADYADTGQRTGARCFDPMNQKNLDLPRSVAMTVDSPSVAGA